MKLKSNEPFWLVKNGLMYSYPSLAKNIDTEIVIIGSGITGSLIAHQCIADGYDVVLVDRREIVNGSSSATTSMLQYEIDTPLYELIDMIGEKAAIACYKACARSIDMLSEIAKSINSKAGFKKKESLYFAANKKDLEWLEKEYEARKLAGFNVKWLSEKEILEKYDLHTAHAGILSDIGASVDAYYLAHELLEFNSKKGLKIFDKTNIKTVNYSVKNVELVTDDNFKIKAKKVIYCNGFESVEIIKDNFVNLLSTYAIISEQLDVEILKKINKTLIWNTADPYIYLRTTADNRILIGGEDEEFVNPIKRDKLLNNKALKLEKKFLKLFPYVPFKTDFSWAGTFGSTKDGLPYIGSHPEFKNSYFVLGFGGNGITFSVIGMEMTKAFLENKKHYLSDYFKFKR